MKILVVDDSAAMRKIIRNALEGMGYSPASVLEATDGMDAIQMLREPRFKIDIVLADWNMPNMDGLKLLKELQAVEQHRNIPFIMVVGETQRDRVPEAIRAGACNYIVKPFTPETLREKVLAIETELIAQRRKKLTETAVIRLETPKVTRRRDSDLPFLAQLPPGPRRRGLRVRFLLGARKGRGPDRTRGSRSVAAYHRGGGGRDPPVE